MNYEEKYKEALEIIKGNLDALNEIAETGAEVVNIQSIKNCFYRAFPELIESEDEKIRKELIEHCKNQAKPYIYTGNEYPQIQSWIDWLEKQGDANKEYWRGYREGKQEVLDKYAELEKQCANSVSITKGNKSVTNAEVISHYTAIDSDGGKCTTASTTIESKFKVGDWVVTSYGKVNQVVSVDKDGDGYTLDDGVYFSDSWCDMYHLWTIEDTKDGDILACGDKVTDCPFIFHNLTEELNPRSYCGVNTLHQFQVNDENGGNWCYSDEVRPATKEQRELLFQKMKEEGYEWDAEKKELKKNVKNCITNNSYETVKFPFKAKYCGKIVNIHCGQLNGDGTKWIKYQSDDKDGFKIYSPEDLEPVEDDSDIIEEGDPQPMSYGKELDEKMYKACELYNNGEYSLADLFFAGVRAEYARAKKNVIEWKPSDNTFYDDICELLCNILYSGRYNTINKDAVRNDLDWLVSMKESLQGKQN